MVAAAVGEGLEGEVVVVCQASGMRVQEVAVVGVAMAVAGTGAVMAVAETSEVATVGLVGAVITRKLTVPLVVPAGPAHQPLMQLPPSSFFFNCQVACMC